MWRHVRIFILLPAANLKIRTTFALKQKLASGNFSIRFLETICIAIRLNSYYCFHIWLPTEKIPAEKCITSVSSTDRQCQETNRYSNCKMFSNVKQIFHITWSYRWAKLADGEEIYFCAWTDVKISHLPSLQQSVYFRAQTSDMFINIQVFYSLPCHDLCSACGFMFF